MQGIETRSRIPATPREQHRSAETPQRRRIAQLISDLKSCDGARHLARGHALHSRARSTGDASNIFAATALIAMYCRCRSPGDARAVFDAMPRRNTIAWTALMLAYAHAGHHLVALRIFSAMLSHPSCHCDSHAFVVAIKALAGLAAAELPRRLRGKLVRIVALERAMAVHSILDDGLDVASDAFLGSALVNLYARCGDLDGAARVFTAMARPSAVAWNSLMIGHTEFGQPEVALELLQQMLRDGCQPSSWNFVAALKACSSLAEMEASSCVDAGRIVKLVSLERGVAVHSQAVKHGCEEDVFVGSTLVDVYANCGSLLDAWRAFCRMPSRNVVSWNSMILGYAENGEPEAALDLFVLMIEEEEVDADDRSYVAALRACVCLAAKDDAAKMVALEKGMAIHARARRSGLDRDVFVANTLVDMYFKCGSKDDACRVFGSIENPTVVSWTSLMLGYVDNGDGDAALELFERMRTRRCAPSAQTFVAALKACACRAADELHGSMPKKNSLERGMAIYNDAVKSGFERNIFVASAAVDLCVKCGSIEDARRIFDRGPFCHGVASWNALILGYVENDEGEAALDLFWRMHRPSPSSGASPNARTYAAALKACRSLASLREAKAIHAEICRSGVEDDRVLTNSLVDVYGKCGNLADAQHVFDSIVAADAIAWNALLTVYSSQGDTDRAFDLFLRMSDDEACQPSAVTYTSLLIACSRAGLVDRGWNLFKSMESKHGIAPSIEHYHCMIDILGRANRVDEAMTLAKSMPFEPNGVTWTTVLSACKSVEAAKSSFESLLGMKEPEHKVGCTLMSNLCSSLLD